MSINSDFYLSVLQEILKFQATQPLGFHKQLGLMFINNFKACQQVSNISKELMNIS